MRSAVGVLLDILTFLQLILRTPMEIAAENLFLRQTAGPIRRAKAETTAGQ